MKNVAASLILLFLSATASAAGFDASYKARIGDIDPDGRLDLYLQSTPNVVLIPFDDLVVPIVTNPPQVADVVLRQNTAGGFDVMSSLTSAQRAAAAQWPAIDPDVILMVEDANADGFMDLIVRNLSEAIGGMLDQIVYAPTQRGQSPPTTTILNASRQKFFKEVYGWMTNGSYFVQNAPQLPSSPGVELVTYLGYIYEPYPPWVAASCVFYDQCRYRYGNLTDPFSDPNNSDGILNVWHWWGVMIATGPTIPDYGVYDPDSLGMAGILRDVLTGVGDIPAGSAKEAAVKAILDRILGVGTVPGAGVFGGVFGQGNDIYTDDEGIDTDRLRAVIQLAQAIQGPPPTGPAPTYVNPLPGAWINKVNTTTAPYDCTADGRFGSFRPGGHNGVDLGSSTTKPVVVGTDVYAAGAGLAVPGVGTGYGTQIELYHSGGKYLFRYGHLSSAIARARVAGGAVVGQVGKTGNASSPCIKPHLHFEAGDVKTGKKVDPTTVSSVFTWSPEP